MTLGDGFLNASAPLAVFRHSVIGFPGFFWSYARFDELHSKSFLNGPAIWAGLSLPIRVPVAGLS
jgi:hypothetical protein